jgi:hypothetical protein
MMKNVASKSILALESNPGEVVNISQLYLSETVDVGVAGVAAVVAAAVGVDVVVAADVFASAFRVVNGGVHDSS